MHLTERHRWFVVRTLPNREQGAAAQLNQQSFATFLPTHRKSVRHARRFRSVLAPLFPSYLFVAMDLGRDHWRSVNGTFGVAGLIMGGEQPLPVPHGVVEQFIAAADDRGAVDFATALRPGGKAEVVAGPFVGLLGQIHATNGAGRVKILLDLMGGKISVWADPGALRPVA